MTPIEFLIPGSADNFIDLSNVYMYLKVQIVNGDGSDVQSTIQVYPECNFLQTFFSECEINLNGKKVSSNSSNYAYRCFLEKLINYDSDSKKKSSRSIRFLSGKK